MDYFQTTQQRNSQQQNSSTSAQQQYLPFNGISQQKFQNSQNTNMFYQQSSQQQQQHHQQQQQQQQHNTQQSGYFQIQPASAPLDAQQSYHQPPQQSQSQSRSHNNGHHQQSGGMYGNNSGNGGQSGGHQQRRGGNNMNQHHNQNHHGHNQQSLQHQSHQQQTSQHNQHHPRHQQQQQQHSQYQQRSHNSNNHQQQNQSHQQSGSSGQSQQQHQSQHQQQHPFGVPPPPLSELPVRIAIESKHVGAIIGQGGNQIRIITKDSHAKVVVETEKGASPNKNNNGGHRQSEEKVINIIGSNENCTKAVYKILEVVQREINKEDGDLGADIELKIRAHDPLVGRLIGKQGATIKQIMHETGTQILVSKFSSETQKHAENSIPLLERTITVRGQTIDCVVQAEAKISAKLKKCYEVDLHHRLQALQTNLQQNNSSITSLTSPSSATDAFGSIQRANSAAAAAAGIPPLPFPNNTMKCLRIWVPDNMVGALIGAKGKHIKQIIRDSQANVKIDSAEEKVKRQEEMNGSNTESNEEVAETSGIVENEKDKENENETENEEKKEEKEGEDVEKKDDEKDEKDEKEDDEKPHNKEKKIEERMVTITGTDLQLLRAQQMIYEKMAEQTPQHFTDLKLRTELSVPSKIVGRIIGKGGQNVRELQRITGAIVKIPEEERNGPQEPVYKDKGEDGTTVVRIIGNVPASHNVQFRLSQLVADYMRSEKKKEQNGTDNNGSNTSSTSPPPAHSPTQQSSSP